MEPVKPILFSTAENSAQTSENVNPKNDTESLFDWIKTPDPIELEISNPEKDTTDDFVESLLLGDSMNYDI